MNGFGAIVMRIRPDGASDNGHRYAEHGVLDDAKREAHRLAAKDGETMVVYVPVAVVTRTPPTQEQVPDIGRQIPEPDCALPF